MYKKIAPLFLLCESPLHAGSGDSLGIVDLLIQRERHTQFPKIESSSLKGALRQAIEQAAQTKEGDELEQQEIKIHQVFGYDSAFENNPNFNAAIKNRFAGKNEFAGAMTLSDARLLLFPVKSMKGVFAWITCPRVILQLQRDLAYAKIAPTWKAENIIQNSVASNKLTLKEKKDKDYVILEEYSFEVKVDINTNAQATKALADWLADQLFDTSLDYWKTFLQDRLIVLSDEDFTDFVELSTEVITRIKIDNETGTVAQGALFNEEYLPAESVLYSLIFAGPEMTKGKGMSETEVYDFLKENIPEVFQVGGNSTLGKGIVRTGKKLFDHERE